MMTPWTLAQRLERVGVLGMNARNGDYILPNNARKLYPLVDDKLLTKELAHKAGLATPELYAAFRASAEVRRARAVLDKYRDFVVKPANGSRGNGIIVIKGRIGDALRLASRRLMTWDDLRFHMQNILSGIYSLGGQPDKAIIEYRVQFDPVFQQITHQGVPDIRIIIFLGVPVMAMVRLPTRMSGGKANLHQGAIGAGIDMATGRTLTAVLQNGIVAIHPDTGNPVTDVKIPNWPALLELGARSYEMTGLGYQGIDIVLDRDRGPLILELNARPGLNIQIANRAGLRGRLKAVEENRDRLGTVAERVAFARENFAAVRQ
jgi:alpha-L-glutamate ligase-like protein